MKYTPTSTVWEITMNCNMRCKHCGSSCEGPHADELTTEEALRVCDSLGKINLRKITLSGGEPFTRDDWHIIAAGLTKNKIITNILSNGWFITGENIRKAHEAGVCNIGISVDGLEETHDFIRKKGSFARIMKSLDLLKENKMSSAVVTCVSTQNIDQLEEMKELLISKGVKDWQFQPAVPMGNLLDHPEWILKPGDIDRIIDFAYDTLNEGRIRAHLADDIGYFNIKEVEIKRASFNSQGQKVFWKGCGAGKDNLGIRCNGDIIGCLSIRDDRYIEGNVRKTPLEELWEHPDAFAWNRKRKKSDLSGFCSVCQYGSYCLGGCNAVKIMHYDNLGETEYCSYYVAAKKEKARINGITDYDQLVKDGRDALKNQDYQTAEMCIAQALKLQPGNIALLNMQGYIHYNLENYPQCEDFNRKALAIEENNTYSLSGLGLGLSKQGKVDEAVTVLKKAVQLADESYMDPYYDLAVVYCDHQRPDEAVAILEEGRGKSEAFTKMSESFYRQLTGQPQEQPAEQPKN